MKNYRSAAVLLSVAAGLAGVASAASTAITPSEADAMLNRIKYQTVVHTGIESNGGTLIDPDSDAYADYMAQFATPGAKLMIVAKPHTVYWNLFQVYGLNGETVLYQSAQNGDYPVPRPGQVMYTQYGVGITDNSQLKLDEYCYYLFDLPNLNALDGGLKVKTGEAWTSDEAHGWNIEVVDMFVAVPKAGYVWELQVFEAPSVIPLGESAPLRAGLVDQRTGVTNEHVEVTCTADNLNCQYADGRVYALSAIDSLDMKVTVRDLDEDETYTASFTVSVPEPNLSRYVELAHWDVDITVSNNDWWSAVVRDAELMQGLTRALNRPMVAVKLSYRRIDPEQRTFDFYGFAVNSEWTSYKTRTILVGDGEESREEIVFFANGFSAVDSIRMNAFNSQFDRITVYRPFSGFLLHLR